MSTEDEGGIPELDLSDGAPSSLGELRVDTVLDSLPALARLAAEAWLRTAVWGVGAGTKAGVRLMRAAIDPRSAAELFHDVGSGMRDYAREFLGVSDLDARVRMLSPGDGRFVAGTGPGAAARSRRGRQGEREEEPNPASEDALRAQGAELLRQSADVRIDDRTHPAYLRILQELAPDEARILRLLAIEGPQPMVDVRAANLIGVGSQLVAQTLNMVGPEAGCRHVDRVPAYLNNLQRLGLIFFSDQPLEDPIRYQVLEAQPYVLEAIKSATRAKTAHRTLRLTPFGKDFCDVCLPLDTAEFEALTGDR
jgi:Abortive infection alpha